LNSLSLSLSPWRDRNGQQLYSVKWYKNYVEFYRFQPQTADAHSSGGGGGGGGQVHGDELAHSRQEFELEGINLNVSSGG